MLLCAIPNDFNCRTTAADDALTDTNTSVKLVIEITFFEIEGAHSPTANSNADVVPLSNDDDDTPLNVADVLNDTMVCWDNDGAAVGSEEGRLVGRPDG